MLLIDQFNKVYRYFEVEIRRKGYKIDSLVSTDYGFHIFKYLSLR